MSEAHNLEREWHERMIDVFGSMSEAHCLLLVPSLGMTEAHSLKLPLLVLR